LEHAVTGVLFGFYEVLGRNRTIALLRHRNAGYTKTPTS
jgi:hypothetical protein